MTVSNHIVLQFSKKEIAHLAFKKIKLKATHISLVSRHDENRRVSENSTGILLFLLVVKPLLIDRTC